MRRWLWLIPAVCLAAALLLAALLWRGDTAPPPAPDWLRQAQQARAAGVPQAARYALLRAAAANGWTAALHRQAADLWLSLGAAERALPHDEATARLDPDPPLLRRLTTAYLQAGRAGDALATLEMLLRLTPDDAWAHYQTGLLLAATDPRRARAALGRVVFDDAYTVVAGALLAVLRDEAGSPAQGFQAGAVLARYDLWQHAEWAFQYAADAGYPFAQALGYAGLMRELQGKDGRTAIRQALQLDPNSADVWLIQGIALRRRESYTDSQAALLTALTLEPNNAAIHAELGASYRAAGAMADAAYWLQSAVRVSGDNPQMVQALTDFYADEAQFLPQQALEALADRAGAEDTNPDMLAAYGWALHVSGDSALGLAKIEEALALEPAHPRALYDKARLLLDVARVDEARPLLAQVAAGSSPYAASAALLLQGIGA
ncbi:MAG: tetratricopeptide repeat protein [Anaerolineae bacterium]|nr:tetratricopeptide repeat protein [Anaerolineae bacterium]